VEFDKIVSETSVKNLLPFTKLYGFTESPPSPGSVSAWKTEDWTEWGRRNNMTDVTHAKHGLKIAHPYFPAICICPSGTPGDVRSIMNCAADFRRTYVAAFSQIFKLFKAMGEAVYGRGIRINGGVPDAQGLASSITHITEKEDLEAFKKFGIAPTEPKEEEITIGVASAYRTMTFLARSGATQIPYGQALVDVSAAIGDPLTLEEADRIAKTLGQANREGDVGCVVSPYVKTIFEVGAEMAKDIRDRNEAEKTLKKAQRSADRAQRVAERDAEAKASERTAEEQVTHEIDQVKAQFQEVLGRFDHDLGQLSTRLNKAKSYVEGIQFPGVKQHLDAVVGQLSEALTRAKALEDSVEAYETGLQALADLVDIPPDTPELAVKIKEAIEARFECCLRYQQRLTAFASTVYDKLSSKDFLVIAKGITEILPEAEKLALTAGD
jgi:uncharacterized protein YdbL (DUF1318 family)